MDIVTQKILAEILAASKQRNVAPYSTTAKVKSISNDYVYVEIFGSDTTTPVKTSNVSVKVGDVVDLIVSHEDTRITGNRSDVAASATEVENVSKTVEESTIALMNDLNVVNNEINAINNKINMQNSTIDIQNSEISAITSKISTIDSNISVLDSSIKTHDSNIESINSTISTHDSKIETLNSKVNTQGSSIESINSTINTHGSKINTLESTVNTQGSSIESINSSISTLESTVNTQGSSIESINSTISTHGSKIETLNSKYVTVDSNIESINSTISTHDSKIETLNSNMQIVNSAFVIKDGKLTGISEIITNILNSGYVTTDLLNADVAWIVDGHIKEGAIGSIEIADSSITTAKIAELSADVITSGTIKTERLILTSDEIDPETGQPNVCLITALNAKAQAGEGNILDGAIISDDSITAAKIDVVDLNALGATIGNFVIDISSIYNQKRSLFDPTNGVYIGTDGIALGQGLLVGLTEDSLFRIRSNGDFHLGGGDGNYVNFDPFTGELEIDAKTIKMGSKTIPDIANNVRNILLNSEGPFVLPGKNTGSASDNFNYYRFYADMTVGETYTISADIEVLVGSFDKVTVYPYPGGNASHESIPESGRITATFTKTSEDTDSVLIYAGVSGETRGNSISITNVKIEKGDIATDWTPAPEDFEENAKTYTNTKFEILDGKIASEVERVNGLSEKVTKFEQDSEGFTWTIDETAIVSSVNEYYKSTSPTTLTGGSWSTTQPTWTEGAYIWMRTKNTNGKGVSAYTTAVCITGNTGEVGGVNLLSDTNIPSMTKKAGPGNKYLSDSGNSSYMSGSYIAVSNLPIPDFTHVYQFDCTTASSTATAGRSLCFYSGSIAPMIDGKVYTMSMYARKTSGNGKIRFMIGYDKYPNYNNYMDVTSKWEKYSYTFTYHDSDVYNDSDKTGGARCYFGANCAVVGTVQICGCKLEKGDKATDWCLSNTDIKYASDQAAKTATNYMNFANNGLTVGNMTTSTLGRNVLIDLDSVDIRNGSEVLASYGENIVLRHAGKDAFTIKDSTFLKDAISDGRMIDDVSYELINHNSDGTIASVRLDARTSSGRYLQANKIYVWHINYLDKYAIFKVPSTVYASEIYHYPSRPAFLLITKISDNTSDDVPCSYADGDAILDTTFKGNVWISSNADVSGYMESIPPLGIGTLGGEHLEIDNNEIIAKTDDQTPGVLYLNSEGGIVSINNNSNHAFRFNNGVIQGRYQLGVVTGTYSNWVDLIQYGSNRIAEDGDDLIISSPKNIRLRPSEGKIILPNAKSFYGTNSNGAIRNNFEPCNINDQCVVGYGSYTASEGETRIFGNVIRMYSKDYIVSNTGFIIPNGKSYCGTNTSGALRNNFQPCNANNNCVVGYASYEESEGATNIYGYNVNLYSKGATNIANGTFKVNGYFVGNHISLWSGALYMKDDQTVTLSQGVTKFAYGIILAFSYYDVEDSAPGNYDWEYFFVPRGHVDNNGGTGIAFGGSNSQHSIYWSKYLYISDTTIRGHANNVLTGTGADGITYKNNRKVLRKVYGI